MKKSDSKRPSNRRQKTCAFLTLENRAGFFIYDDLAFEPLGKLGWSVVEIPWNQPDVDWQLFDVVVIRSTWDYQHSPEQFFGVLSAIESCGTKLFNSTQVCQRNQTGFAIQTRSISTVENPQIGIMRRIGSLCRARKCRARKFRRSRRALTSNPTPLCPGRYRTKTANFQSAIQQMDRRRADSRLRLH